MSLICVSLPVPRDSQHISIGIYTTLHIGNLWVAVAMLWLWATAFRRYPRGSYGFPEAPPIDISRIHLLANSVNALFLYPQKLGYRSCHITEFPTGPAPSTHRQFPVALRAIWDLPPPRSASVTVIQHRVVCFRITARTVLPNGFLFHRLLLLSTRIAGTRRP